MHKRAIAAVPVGIIPPYGPHKVDPEEWRQYLATTGGRIGALVRTPQGAPKPLFPVVRKPKPEMHIRDAVKEALANADTRCMGFQAPHWEALRLGFKDVENRSQPFRGKWLFVVASKPSFGQAELKRRLADVQRRLEWNCSGLAQPIPPISQRMEHYEKNAQHIVALLRVQTFDNIFTQIGQSSIWNNGDPYAWVVEARWAFKEPVYLGPGMLGQVRMSTLADRNNLKNRIIAACEA